MKITMADSETDLFAKEMDDVVPRNVDKRVSLKTSTDEFSGQQYRREKAAYHKGEVEASLYVLLRKSEQKKLKTANVMLRS